MPKIDQQEREHAAAELRALGIRNAFGVVPNDAMAFISYLAMAIKFALIVRPEFRELRLAAAMYDVWRNTASAPAEQFAGEPGGEGAGSLESLLHLDFREPTDEQLQRLLTALREPQ